MSLSHSNVHEIARIGFSKEVDNYEKARPTYTKEAFKLALDKFGLDKNHDEKINVLDLAAGTGKFTKFLVDHENFNVFAVEPNDKMREIFKKNYPTIPLYDGLSTKIPFNDNFFQVVFIAQAFHWFSNIDSLREIYRILKPQSECKSGKSGIFLLFNMEDCDHLDYMKEIFDICSKYDNNLPHYYTLDWKNVFHTKEANELFDEINLNYLENKEIYLPINDVWNRVLSKSFIATLDENTKMDVKKQIENIVEKNKSLHKYRDDKNQMCLQYPYKLAVSWCFSKK